MGLSVQITKNEISPRLNRMARTARDRVVVLRAMGTTFKSITEGTFNSVGARYRPLPWKSKVDGTPSILQKSTTMAKAFFLEVTTTFARVSNPMIYAAIHQFGGKIKSKSGDKMRFKIGDRWVAVPSVTMPPRPFFPVRDGRMTPEAENLVARAGERVIARGN